MKTLASLLSKIGIELHSEKGEIIRADMTPNTREKLAMKLLGISTGEFYELRTVLSVMRKTWGRKIEFTKNGEYIFTYWSKYEK